MYIPWVLLQQLTMEKSWLQVPSEILGFYCGFESFMAWAILEYWSQGNIFKIKINFILILKILPQRIFDGVFDALFNKASKTPSKILKIL